MTDCVNASKDAMQPSRGDFPADSALRVAELQKLAACDNAVLIRRQTPVLSHRFPH
jgi:hypothetical protein